MVTEARSFVVTTTASELRRRLGATAWVVLEELLAHTHDTDAGRWEATASVRSIAADLGVSKDAVARALGRLRTAGIVTAVQSRASTGAFTTGSYRIELPVCLQLIDQSTSIADQPRPRRPLHRASDVAQLSLIDLDASTT